QTFSGLRWGFVTLQTGQQAKLTVPAVLRWLPVALLVDLARAAAAFYRRDATRLRPLVLLVISTLAAMVSVANYPDFIHAGFVGALLAVVAVENVDWALRLPGLRLLGGVGGCVIAGGLLVAEGFVLARHLRLARAEYPIAHQTAFGRVDFPTRERAQVVDIVR